MNIPPMDLLRVEMLGLTVWGPWAHLIADGVKPQENRFWRPRGRFWCAIHAGKTVEPVGDWCPEALQRYQVATMPRQAILALVEFVSFDKQLVCKWDMAKQWHWRIGTVIKLEEPVPCSGSQKLWAVFPGPRLAVLAQVREQVQAMAAAREGEPEAMARCASS